MSKQRKTGTEVCSNGLTIHWDDRQDGKVRYSTSCGHSSRYALTSNLSKARQGTGLCLGCVNKAIGANQRGSNHHNWKGGVRLDKSGYRMVHYTLVDEQHHDLIRWNNMGYCREHRLVMVIHLGRPLHEREVVHHLNGIKDDNRLCNLAVLDRSEHGSATVADLLRSEVLRLQGVLESHGVTY